MIFFTNKKTADNGQRSGFVLTISISGDLWQDDINARKMLYSPSIRRRYYVFHQK